MELQALRRFVRDHPGGVACHEPGGAAGMRPAVAMMPKGIVPHRAAVHHADQIVKSQPATAVEQ
jgi:hypothetical protein